MLYYMHPILGCLVRGARWIQFKDPLGIYYYLLHVKTGPHPGVAHLGTAQALMPSLETERERRGCNRRFVIDPVGCCAQKSPPPREITKFKRYQLKSLQQFASTFNIIGIVALIAVIFVKTYRTKFISQVFFMLLMEDKLTRLKLAEIKQY